MSNLLGKVVNPETGQTDIMPETPETARLYAANLVKTLAAELLLATLGELGYPCNEAFAHWDFEPTSCEAGDHINVSYCPIPVVGVRRLSQVQLRLAEHTFLVHDGYRFFSHPRHRVAPVRNAAAAIRNQICTDAPPKALLVTRRLPIPSPGSRMIGELAEYSGAFGLRVTVAYLPGSLTQSFNVSVLYGVGDLSVTSPLLTPIALLG